MEQNFKTSMIGGFDKKDVIDYIEKSAREANQKIDNLQKENEALKKELVDNRSSLSHLDDISNQNDEYLTTINKMEEQLNALFEENTQLKSRVAELEEPAAQYYNLKEHIAEIEISAHRRNEEFKNKILGDLRETVRNQTAWCDEKQAEYQNMVNALQDKIREGADVLNDVDLGMFEKIKDSLFRISDELDNN